jgi:rubredoxin
MSDFICPKCGTDKPKTSLAILDSSGKVKDITHDYTFRLLSSGFGYFVGVLFIVASLLILLFIVTDSDIRDAISSEGNLILYIGLLILGFAGGIGEILNTIRIRKWQALYMNRCNKCGYIWYQARGKAVVDSEKLRSLSIEANPFDNNIQKGEQQPQILEQPQDKGIDAAPLTAQNLDREELKKANLALVEAGNEGGIRPLIKSIDGEAGKPLLKRDFKFMNRSISALAKMGDQAIDPMIDLLQKGTSEASRSMAAAALGVYGGERALDALIKAKETDESAAVQVTASDAIKKIKKSLQKK